MVDSMDSVACAREERYWSVVVWSSYCWRSSCDCCCCWVEEVGSSAVGGSRSTALEEDRAEASRRPSNRLTTESNTVQTTVRTVSHRLHMRGDTGPELLCGVVDLLVVAVAMTSLFRTASVVCSAPSYSAHTHHTNNNQHIHRETTEQQTTTHSVNKRDVAAVAGGLTLVRVCSMSMNSPVFFLRLFRRLSTTT